MTLFPTRHREDHGRRLRTSQHLGGPRHIERRQTGIEMKRERRLIPRLTVTQPGELFAVAEQKLDLETRCVQLDQLVAVQFHLGRSQHDVARLVRLLAINEDHDAQLPLERDVPHLSRIEMRIVNLLKRAQILEAAQVREADLAVILAPPTRSLLMQVSEEEPTIGVAPQLGDGMQTQTSDFIHVLLLGKLAVPAVIGDLLRQALPLRTQLSAVEINAGLFPSSRRLLRPRLSLSAGDDEGAPARHIYDREGGNLQPALGPSGTAVEVDTLADEDRGKVVRQLVPRVVVSPRQDGRVKVSATYAFAPPVTIGTDRLRAAP